MPVQIIKSTGAVVEFNPDKIRATLRRAGTKAETIEKVLAAVETQLRDGMSTRELFGILKHELRRADHPAAQRYNLRSGLLRLGPAGFRFEQYVAAVLAAYQYETEIPAEELSGLCVNHEIDVIAKKDGRAVMIEAKFRNHFGDVVNLKDTMATWARWVDLVDGSKAGKCPPFDEAWIVTNGRFTDRAQQFGVCKGMHLIGWSSTEHSFARLVDHANLYPVTVLDYLRNYEIERLSQHNLMLCSDIARRNPEEIAAQLGMEPVRLARIVGDCREIINVNR